MRKPRANPELFSTSAETREYQKIPIATTGHVPIMYSGLSERCRVKSYGQPRRRRVSGKLRKYYEVPTYDPESREQRWESTRCSSLPEAKRWIKARQREEIEGPRRDPSSIPFPKALRRWLDSKLGTVNDRHWLNLSCRASKYWSKFFGKADLAEITRDQVREYLRRRREGTIPGSPSRAMSVATVNNDLRAMRTFFKFCVDEGWIEKSPADNVKQISGAMKRRQRTLSPEEWSRLLEACREEYVVVGSGRRNAGGTVGGQTTHETTWEQRYRPPTYLHPIVTIALYCGFRRRTILSLDWSHVDLRSRMWRIPGELVKTQRDIQAPIPSSVVSSLLDYCPEPPSNGPIFGLSPTSSITKSFQAACERAGLRGFTFHGCRGAFLNRLRSLQIDLDVAMSLTGHMDVETVMRHYRQVSVEEQKVALDRLDACEP